MNHAVKGRTMNVMMRTAAVWMILAAAALPAGAQQRAAVARGANAEARTAGYLESIRTNPSELALFMRDMPKGADLHNHLSGGIYAETFIRWAAQDSMCVDTRSMALVRPPCDVPAGRPAVASAFQNAGLYGDIIDAWSMRNWDPARNNGHDQFFDTFGKFGPASGGARTADMLVEVTARAARNRVSYMELMWTPDGSSALGRRVGWTDDLVQMRERVLGAGLRDSLVKTSRRLDTIFAAQRSKLGCETAQRDPGCDVEVRVLYQVLRALPPEMTYAMILAGFELANSDPRVVGLNLVQPEDDYVAMRDYSLHMRMIQSLRPLYPDVKVTLHAGELAPGLVPPEGLRFHIREAVRVAGANRIGHGVDIAHEDDAVALLQEMARRKIMVEIALTSNAGILGIEGSEHPLHLYMKYGVPVALATDDEGVSRSDMNMEYQRAVVEQGIGYVALKQMARNSIQYSFADDVTRKRLMASLDRSFAVLEAKYGR